jgi:hypothetical protein
MCVRGCGGRDAGSSASDASGSGTPGKGGRISVSGIELARQASLDHGSARLLRPRDLIVRLALLIAGESVAKREKYPPNCSTRR